MPNLYNAVNKIDVFPSQRRHFSTTHPGIDGEFDKRAAIFKGMHWLVSGAGFGRF